MNNAPQTQLNITGINRITTKTSQNYYKRSLLISLLLISLVQIFYRKL